MTFLTRAISFPCGFLINFRISRT